MIDNIIMILKLTLTQPSLNYKEIVEECNPLGLLPDLCSGKLTLSNPVVL